PPAQPDGSSRASPAIMRESRLRSRTSPPSPRTMHSSPTAQAGAGFTGCRPTGRHRATGILRSPSSRLPLDAPTQGAGRRGMTVRVRDAHSIADNFCEAYFRACNLLYDARPATLGVAHLLVTAAAGTASPALQSCA